MSRKVLPGRVVAPDKVIDDGVVVVDGDQITFVGAAADVKDDLPEPVGTLLPGLVDIHCHGGGGASFTLGDDAEVSAAAAHHLAQGTTSVVASAVTDSPDRMLASVRASAAAAARSEVAAIHLEGPFLSSARCGAQDPRHLLHPDLGLARDLLEAGEGFVRMMTLAPELPGAETLADLLVERDVVAAVGHTEASASITARVLGRQRAGLATHLFNGMPSLHHRAPGPVGGALAAAAQGNARVELIADGVHLADETVALVFTLLGSDRIVLVTDAMAASTRLLAVSENTIRTNWLSWPRRAFDPAAQFTSACPGCSTLLPSGAEFSRAYTWLLLRAKNAVPRFTRAPMVPAMHAR